MAGTQHLVIMGVAGCGKTTTAPLLAERLGWKCAEGDSFHPEANIAKMSAGEALTDDDRWPWLASIRAWITEREAAGESSIVTCSALRRVYRDALRDGPGRVRFVHLSAPEALIGGRIGARGGHFMPPSLLPSQFQTLEPLGADEDGVVVGVESDPETVASTVLDLLDLATR